MRYRPTNRSLFSFVLMFFTLCLASGAVMAQSDRALQPSIVNKINGPELDHCSIYPETAFTYGSGAPLFKFCLSDRGHIIDITSPSGFKHMSFGQEEGYAICGTGATKAFSTASIESNDWSAPILDQPGGPNTLPLTITRQSPDGKFELKQSFDWNTGKKEIFITMELKNLSAASITNVRLSRYFDGEIDNDYGDNILDRNSDSVWGIDAGAGTQHHGLILSALTLTQTHTAFVEKFSDWNTNGQDGTGEGCTAIGQNVPTAPGNYVGRITYVLGTLAAGASKTVKFVYRRI